MDESAATREFWESTRRLTLPPGATWPVAPPFPSPEPDLKGEVHPNSYEQGYGIVVAEGIWRCAWQREWLAQRGKDPNREAAALHTLKSVRDSYTYTKSSDASYKRVVENILVKAELGDPTPMARDVQVGCQGV